MTGPVVGAIGGHYEALRASVLHHRAHEERRGFALFVRDGMAAWIDAWIRCPIDAAPITSGRPSRHDGSVISAPSTIVSLLASMVLSTLQEHPS